MVLFSELTIDATASSRGIDFREVALMVDFKITASCDYGPGLSTMLTLTVSIPIRDD